jgi:hypothetical protein
MEGRKKIQKLKGKLKPNCISNELSNHTVLAHVYSFNKISDTEQFMKNMHLLSHSSGSWEGKDQDSSKTGDFCKDLSLLHGTF